MKTIPKKVCVVFERGEEGDWDAIFTGERDSADQHEADILASDDNARTVVVEFQRSVSRLWPCAIIAHNSTRELELNLGGVAFRVSETEARGFFRTLREALDRLDPEPLRVAK